MEHTTNTRNPYLVLLSIILLGVIAFLGYQDYSLNKQKTALQIELTNTKADFASTTESLQKNIAAIQQLLMSTQSDKVTAEQDIQKQQAVLDAMSGTLGLYQKLANTDKELLEKYSKVFFLSENYVPKSLFKIPDSYVIQPDKEKDYLTQAWPFLQKLLDDASAAGVDLKILSAYRSFSTQVALKSSYKVTFGSGANTFSADQGYSEHQLGTAVDFTTVKLNTDNTGFEKTAGFKWLTANAYKYGFILSYPKSNAYYVYEPWHWRFVGKGLANTLHSQNINFADMPQREIDSFLVSIFDNLNF